MKKIAEVIDYLLRNFNKNPTLNLNIGRTKGNCMSPSISFESWSKVVLGHKFSDRLSVHLLRYVQKTTFKKERPSTWLASNSVTALFKYLNVLRSGWNLVRMCKPVLTLGKKNFWFWTLSFIFLGPKTSVFWGILGYL